MNASRHQIHRTPGRIDTPHSTHGWRNELIIVREAEMRRCLFIASMLLVFSVLGCTQGQQPADYVFTNGKVYTVNENRPWAEAAAVKGNQIVFVGSSEDAKAYVGPNTKVGDLRGKMMMPGLIDTHLHAMIGAVATSGVWVAGIKDADEILSTIREYAKAHPNKELIFGWGYGNVVFGPEGPSKELLDRAVPDRPAYIVREDGHSAWANTKALSLTGVDKNTPDPAPPAGTFGRDANGNPTGAINGGPANLWMINRLPALVTDESLQVSAEPMLKGITELGITSLFDAGAPIGTEAVFQYLVDRDNEGKLPVRYFASYYINSASQAAGAVQRLKELDEKYKSRNFSVKTLKITTDGVVENRKAAVFEPYNDGTGNGALNFKPETIAQLSLDVAREGYDIYMHTLGDRAVHEGLNAAQVVREAGLNDTHITLSHCQLVNEKDRPRFKEINVIINSTGGWMGPFEGEEVALGDRVNTEYPYRSMIDKGVLFVNGSDFPADPRIDPFLHLEVSVTRQPPGSPESSKIKNPKHRLSVKEAIEAYTINGAKMLRMKDKIGSLEVGKLADLIVLDQNIVGISLKQIHKTQVLLTMMDGKVWHDFLFEWGDSRDDKVPEFEFYWDGESHSAFLGNARDSNPLGRTTKLPY